MLVNISFEYILNKLLSSDEMNMYYTEHDFQVDFKIIEFNQNFKQREYNKKSMLRKFNNNINSDSVLKLIKLVMLMLCC